MIKQIKRFKKTWTKYLSHFQARYSKNHIGRWNWSSFASL